MYLLSDFNLANTTLPGFPFVFIPAIISLLTISCNYYFFNILTCQNISLATTHVLDRGYHVTSTYSWDGILISLFFGNLSRVITLTLSFCLCRAFVASQSSSSFAEMLAVLAQTPLYTTNSYSICPPKKGHMRGKRPRKEHSAQARAAQRPPSSVLRLRSVPHHQLLAPLVSAPASRTCDSIVKVRSPPAFCLSSLGSAGVVG